MAAVVLRQKTILLINPNTSEQTTAMMVAIARSCVPDGVVVSGATATRGPPMITTPAALAAAADEVVDIGIRDADGMSGLIVGAFGDPGLETLRQRVSIPAVGICEAAMLEAAAGGRRFGVATVTPELVAPITERARDLGLLHLFTGIRLTPGDPVALAADASRLQARLADAVAECFDEDHAEAVIIGGGPLGQAANGLAQSFERARAPTSPVQGECPARALNEWPRWPLASLASAAVIAPIPSAVRQLLAVLGDRPA